MKRFLCCIALNLLSFSTTPYGADAVSKPTPVRIGEGGIFALRYSPDGRWISAITSKGVELYTEKRVEPLLIDAEAKTLAFSPDSALIAIALHDSSIQIWSTETRGRLGSIPKAEREIAEIWFASKGGDTSLRLHAGLIDGTVLRWRIVDL